MKNQTETSAQRARDDKRMQETQSKVDEVVDIMSVNVKKIFEKDLLLSGLDQRAKALRDGASMIKQQAGTLKRKHWWNHYKMMFIIGGVGLSILIIALCSAFGGLSSRGAAPVTSAPLLPH